MDIRWCCLIVIVFLNLSHINCQSCTCDLTSNKCNINCCCDPDCSTEEKTTFSSCIPVNENRLEEVCVSDSLLFSANGKYNAEGTAGGLFCIYRDNYRERSLFTNVEQTNTRATFDSLAAKHKSFSFQASNNPTEALENTYKDGDLIYIQFVNKRYGYLSQPTAIPSTLCTDDNPARFLKETETNCVRSVSNLAIQCASETAWKADTYYKGFTIAPFPSFVVSSGESSTNSTLPKEAITITVKKPLQCQSTDGSISDCTFTEVPQPTFEAGTGCKNVPHEISYTVSYKTNETTFISTVEVSFIFKEIQINAKILAQTFKTNFIDVIAANATNTSLIVDRSGNPGYIIGLPVRSGNLSTDEETKISTVTPISISLLSSSLTGTCTNDRSPLLFGTDYRSGCFVRIKSTMDATECQQLQNTIYQVLIGQLPTHIATFGNSLLDTSGGWVQLINEQPAAKPDVSNGECINMITDVTFKILFANTGFFANPQQKIVGFQVLYGSSRTLQYRCYGTICDSTSEQNVEISQLVSYVDVTSAPQSEERSIPKFRSKAPNDFFYPFF